VVVVGVPLFTVVGHRRGCGCFDGGWSWWWMHVFSQWLVVVVRAAILTVVGCVVSAHVFKVVGRGGGCGCFDGGLSWYEGTI